MTVCLRLALEQPSPLARTGVAMRPEMFLITPSMSSLTEPLTEVRLAGTGSERQLNALHFGDGAQ
jgi:hypothetical protein